MRASSPYKIHVSKAVVEAAIASHSIELSYNSIRSWLIQNEMFGSCILVILISPETTSAEQFENSYKKDLVTQEEASFILNKKRPTGADVLSGVVLGSEPEL